MTNTFVLKVDKNYEGMRLDKYIVSQLPELSRTRVQYIIEKGGVSRGINEPLTDCSYRIRNNDQFLMNIPEPEETHLRESDIPINIIYEDDHLLVIDKQAGLTVHPGAGNKSETLVNALLKHCKTSLSGIGGVMRPGIVHRLDKDTSGLMVVAKNDKSHKELARQIKEREFTRIYNALVWGKLSPPAGRISVNIARSKRNREKMAVYKTIGKEAITNYKTLEAYRDIVSLVECKLKTGRTHQIRVHLAYKGHPLIGDKTYGTGKIYNPSTLPEKTANNIRSFPRQALHSVYIGFVHPVTGNHMEFNSKIALSSKTSSDIAELIEQLKKQADDT